MTLFLPMIIDVPSDIKSPEVAQNFIADNLRALANAVESGETTITDMLDREMLFSSDLNVLADLSESIPSAVSPFE